MRGLGQDVKPDEIPVRDNQCLHLDLQHNLHKGWKMSEIIVLTVLPNYPFSCLSQIC